MSLADCTSGAPDSDHDGLSDLCESTLARAFAPVLVVEPGGCDWDASTVPGRVGGAYLFGVAPAGGDAVRVAYLPAYFRDCGWSGPKCLLPGVGCAGHSGDSEFMAVELRPHGQRWRITRMVLSAHCFGRRPRCAWDEPVAGGAGTWLDGRPGGAPVVFVASGTHAAYRTRRACDAGHYGLDRCDDNHVAYRFPVEPSRNIGSRAFPVGGDGCVGLAEIGWEQDDADPDRTECLWDGSRPFRGWQADETGDPPSPYERYLRTVLGW
jgi:hypothetical protein